jgi:hypothetical protein
MMPNDLDDLGWLMRLVVSANGSAEEGDDYGAGVAVGMFLGVRLAHDRPDLAAMVRGRFERLNRPHPTMPLQ